MALGLKLRRAALRVALMGAVAGSLAVPLPAATALGPRATDLDPSFGVGGVVLQDAGADRSRVTAAVLQPGGNLLLAGFADSESGEAVSLSRLRPDGSFDPVFGDDGRIKVSIGSHGFGHEPALALGADGRPVVAAVSGDDLVLLRFLADGTADPTFGAAGRVTEAFPADNPPVVTAIAVHPVDGRIVTSAATLGSDRRTRVFRHLTSGARDGTFGLGGVTDVDPSTGLVTARSVAFDGDRIVLAGSGTDLDGAGGVAVTRLVPTGVPDLTFGLDGTVNPGSGDGTPSAAHAVVVADGRIVVTGTTGAAYPDASMRSLTLRLLSSGSLDPTFGSGGRSILASSRSGFYTQTTALARSGSGFVVAGTTGSPTGSGALNSDAFVARLTTTGVLDATFAGSGRVEVDSGRGDDDTAEGVVADTAGVVTLAGAAGAHSFAARRLAGGGADLGFAVDGAAVLHAGSHGADSARDHVVLPDGDIVVAGHGGDFFEQDIVVARFDADGSLDIAFGDRGIAVLDLGKDSSEVVVGVGRDPDGRLVVAGTAYRAGNPAVFVVRFLGDGSVDPAFGQAGVAWWVDASSPLTARSLVLNTQGVAFVAAVQFRTGGSPSTVLLATDPDGNPLSTFGAGGRAVSPVTGPVFGSGPFLVLHGQGLVVAGALGEAVDADVAVARHLSSGALDPAFGSGGVVRVDVAGEMRADAAADVLVSPGSILVLATSEADGRRQGGLVRLNGLGRLDLTFGSAGSVRVDYPARDTDELRGISFEPGALARDGSGRILYTVSSRYSGSIGVVRHLANGSPDAAFDGDGYVATPLPPPIDGIATEGLEVLADGRFLGVGTVSSHDTGDFGLYRMLGVDTPLPTLSLTDGQAVEGEGPVEFRVTLSGPSDRPVGFRVRATPGTAESVDYFRPGSLTSDLYEISPGATETVVRIQEFDDDADEGTESFSVSLFDPRGAGILDGEAVGVIVDEDPPPTVSVADATTGEGSTLAFEVMLSQPSSATVEVTAFTSAGTAQAGADYPETARRLVFPPGARVMSFEVPTRQDAEDEPDETVQVLLYNADDAVIARGAATGTIRDDDEPPPSTTTNETEPPPGTADPATTATSPKADPFPSGYWMLGEDGRVYGFGDAAPHGDFSGLDATGFVDIEPSRSGEGYWLLNGADSTMYPRGDAPPFGRPRELNRLEPGEQMVSLSRTPSGQGLWVFTNHGRVFTTGDAHHFGDLAGKALNAPVLDSIATPTGNGYYMVAGDGGIFAFGDAKFYGSMGGNRLNAPIQSLVPDSDNVGYWLVASDGGIFAFDAPFKGSMGGKLLNKPVTGMVRFGDGYLMVGEDGGIFNFSNKPFDGSLGTNPPVRPIVSVAALG